MRPDSIGALVVLAALVVAGVVSSSSAFTPTGNPREVPVQPVDQNASNGLVGAMDALRIGKLAASWDELRAMPRPGQLGGPRSDLGWRGLIDFADGRRAFRQVFEPAQGLGPGFNERACANCHSHPNTGGGGPDMGVSVATVAPPDDPRDTVGTQKYAIAGHKAQQIAATTPRRRTPPLYGIGLLDEVPDDALKAHADPNDRDKDGISGVLNERGHPAGGKRPARFGHKCNEPNLLRFIGAALFGEMGVTNRASRAAPKDKDKIKDPEAPVGYVARVDAFVRGLAPPPRGPIGPAERRGEKTFQVLGCTGCHKPRVGHVTGAYTDMLVHDLGTAVSDGLYDGKAGPTEWRTPALWGLRHRKKYLHDERAASLDTVLAFHGGEAAETAGRYRKLGKRDAADLKAFLDSL